MRIPIQTVAVLYLLACLPTTGSAESNREYACGESAPPKRAQPMRVLQRVRLLTKTPKATGNRHLAGPQDQRTTVTRRGVPAPDALASETVAKRPSGLGPRKISPTSGPTSNATVADAATAKVAHKSYSARPDSSPARPSNLVTHADYVVEIVPSKTDANDGRPQLPAVAKTTQTSGNKVQQVGFDDPVEVPPIDEATLFATDDNSQSNPASPTEPEEPTGEPASSNVAEEENPQSDKVESPESKRTSKTKGHPKAKKSKPSEKEAHADEEQPSNEETSPEERSPSSIVNSQKPDAETEPTIGRAIRKNVSKRQQKSSEELNAKLVEPKVLAPRLRTKRKLPKPDSQQLATPAIRDPANSPELWEPIDPVGRKPSPENLRTPRTVEALVAEERRQAPNSAPKQLPNRMSKVKGLVYHETPPTRSSQQLSQRLSKMGQSRAANQDRRQLSQEELLELVRRNRQRRWPWQR